MTNALTSGIAAMKKISFLILVFLSIGSYASNGCELKLKKNIDLTGDGIEEFVQLIITTGSCVDAEIIISIDKKEKGRVFEHRNPIRSTGYYSIDFGSTNETAQAEALANDIFTSVTKVENLPVYTKECGTEVIVSEEYYSKLRKQNIKVFSYFAAGGGDTYGFVPELDQVIHLISYTTC